MCKSCFDADTDETTAPPPYDEGYVFEFLQETYCFESDTFVCATYDDPSRMRKYRS